LSLLALIGVYFKWITVVEFVYVTAGIYFLAFIVTMLYAFYLKNRFQFSIPIMPKIMVYTFLLLSGSVATLLLDIDKIMLNQYIKIENMAYYSVATYIALLFQFHRAMHQIVYPITAKLMHDNKHDELNDL
jgi:O-antigen/teichoic acid export membrane protein